MTRSARPSKHWLELMVPLLISNAARSTLVTAIGHTGDSATYATFGTVDGEP